MCVVILSINVSDIVLDALVLTSVLLYQAKLLRKDFSAEV